MLADRNALVVGATGFVGRALVGGLLRDGVRASSLIFRNRPRPAQVEGELIESGSSSEEDLRAALSGCHWDCVYHVAAAGVSPDQRSPGTLIDGNLGLLSRVLLALQSEPPRRFIFTGSCAEYSRAEAPHRITEEHPTMPENAYGAAKAAATIWGSALAKGLGIPFVALRLFHIYGAGEAPSRLVPYLIDCLENGVGAKLTKGEQVRDVLDVSDVVRALIAAGQTESCLRPVYNVCSGEPVQICDLASTAAKLLGKPAGLLQFGALPYRADEEMWIVGDNRRFAEDVQWSPAVKLEDGLREVIRARRSSKAIS